MTKKELAVEVAKRMKQVRPEVNIERTARVLEKGMTRHELLTVYNSENFRG